MAAASSSSSYTGVVPNAPFGDEGLGVIGKLGELGMQEVDGTKCQRVEVYLLKPGTAAAIDEAALKPADALWRLLLRKERPWRETLLEVIDACGLLYNTGSRGDVESKKPYAYRTVIPLPDPRTGKRQWDGGGKPLTCKIRFDKRIMRHALADYGPADVVWLARDEGTGHGPHCNRKKHFEVAPPPDEGRQADWCIFRCTGCKLSLYARRLEGADPPEPEDEDWGALLHRPSEAEHAARRKREREAAAAAAASSSSSSAAAAAATTAILARQIPGDPITRAWVSLAPPITAKDLSMLSSSSSESSSDDADMAALPVPGEEEGEEYEVERIVGHKLDADGIFQYRVKWLHHPSSANTWAMDTEVLHLPAFTAYHTPVVLERMQREMEVHMAAKAAAEAAKAKRSHAKGK